MKLLCLIAKHGGELDDTIEIDGCCVRSGTEAKCLGYWWSSNLFATKSVHENIQKARRAFFYFGSIGVFQGDLSPLSTRSVIETCVVPILLYGSENWILTDVLLKKLDSFLAELAKRALKWPKYHSNTAALVVLDLESAWPRVFRRKLSFLRKLLDVNGVGVGVAAMKALLDDVEMVCLVRECRELEDGLDLNFTNKILCNDNISMKEIKSKLREVDKEKLLRRCTEKAPIIAVVAEKIMWPRLWDKVRDLGDRHVKGLQSLARIMSSPAKGKRPCPLCDVSAIEKDLIDHILEDYYQRLKMSMNEILKNLESEDLKFLYVFWSVYRSAYS